MTEKKIKNSVCPLCGTKTRQHPQKKGYKCEQCRRIHGG